MIPTEMRFAALGSASWDPNRYVCPPTQFEIIREPLFCERTHPVTSAIRASARRALVPGKGSRFTTQNVRSQDEFSRVGAIVLAKIGDFPPL